MKAIYSILIKINIIMVILIITILFSAKAVTNGGTAETTQTTQQVQNAITNEKIEQIEKNIEKLNKEVSGKVDSDTYKDLYNKTVDQLNQRIVSANTDKDFMYTILFIFATFVAGIATYIGVNEHLNSKKVKEQFMENISLKEELNGLKTEVTDIQAGANEVKISAETILAEIEASAKSIEETKKEIDQKAEKISGFYTKFDDLESKSVGIVTTMVKLKDVFEAFNKDGNNDNFKQAVAELAHEASGFIDDSTTQKISEGLEIEAKAISEEIDEDDL